MANGNITVGTMAIAKVGRNAITVEVIAIADGGAFLVRNKAGKKFKARRLEPMPNAVSAAEPAQQIIIQPTKSAEPEYVEMDAGSKASREAIEITGTETPAKHLSLMNAAVEILCRSEHPLNTREIVAQAVTAGLWTPTDAKTPEQTLYGTIFREIATKEYPRIVKSAVRGKFELNHKV
ncbi:MAG: HTH domain-containing protein [Smithellaceae bacterium]|mgnify:CR=1 FL=1